MSTYYNGYSILKSVRQGINEYGQSGLQYLQGTDTTCAHQNDWLMEKINSAQRYIYSLIYQRIPGQFLTSTTLTGVNSVFTLPFDFGVLVEFRDEDGYHVYPVGVPALKPVSVTGSDSHYYRRGNTLVLDKDSVTDTYTLWDHKKPREISQGRASAGAATSITLATSAKVITDYYNGMTLENITSAWIDTIDDYTAARVATISETAATSDYYGIVPDIPEIFHHLIPDRAILEVKATSPVIQEKPGRDEYAFFNESLKAVLDGFGNGQGDVYAADLWTSYGDEGLGLNRSRLGLD